MSRHIYFYIKYWSVFVLHAAMWSLVHSIYIKAKKKALYLVNFGQLVGPETLKINLLCMAKFLVLFLRVKHYDTNRCMELWGLEILSL